ncbi:MAG: SpoVA/SpoVAEb family sporulation membrane protein [Firmicutes bacterium]|nr:SpoVA/SpoVAEb family sporulation membrane protein [Bacillota bacterium]
MLYLKVFAVGGLICLIGQVLIITTKITPARILVAFVLAGVLLEGIGVYKYITEFAGAGAIVPIVGFGAAIAKGAIEMGAADGIMGVLAGGLVATAAGIAAAVGFAFVFALIFKPRTKKC